VQAGVFEHFTVQAGARPRWAPPHRVTAGRVYLPGLGQPDQGIRFPLFMRQAGSRRLPAPFRLRQGRYSRRVYIPVAYQASAAWAATGQMHATAFLTRHAAMAPMTAAGRMIITGTRQVYSSAAWHATASMTIKGTAVRPAAIHLTASGHLTASATLTRVAPRIPLTAAGRMSIAGTVTRRAAITMRATGSMHIAGTRVLPGVIHLTASGHLTAAASVTRMASAAWHGTGVMSIAAVTAPGIVMRASGRMGIVAQQTSRASVSMAAQGAMTVSADAAPPPVVLQIEPGAVTAPEEVIDSGAWQVRQEPPGPDEVTVDEIEPGY
jgi:hypothetical protein